MPRQSSDPAASPARQRLLEAVLAHFTAAGLGDQSLRQIASSVGTSHRMLLYHFGSKDGLLLEVVREVEARTEALFEAIGEASGDRVDEIIRRTWTYVANPAVAGFERLFFALYSRALQGDEAVLPLLTDDVEHWLRANTALPAMAAVPVDVARAHARLGLAVTRGLLLDLLATGDRAGVDAALEVFARGYANTAGANTTGAGTTWAPENPVA